MPVDLQEKRQLDLGGQVARVKAHTRPWRSIIATVLALAAAVVSIAAGRRFSDWDTSGQLVPQVIALSTAAAFCVLALMAVIGFAGKSRDLMQPVTGRAHAAVVRYTVVLIGSVATLVITLGLLKVPIDQLLVGGAVTTIILGIAAQQSLSNVFSGIVLLLSHPFGVGDAVSFRSGAFSGQIEGIVVEIGISYVRVETAGGVLHLPNSQVLAAAVGPVPGHAQDSTAPDSTARRQHSARQHSAGQHGARQHSGAAAAQPIGSRQPGSRLAISARPPVSRAQRYQLWAASYRVTTSAGIRPRSLTSIPVFFAQARTLALCWRCAAVLRLMRTGRADDLRARWAYRLIVSSNLSLCLTHRSIS